MGKQLKKIKQTKRNNSLSNYVNKAYENGYEKGFKYGTTQSVLAFAEKVKELENVEGLKHETLLKIIDTLEIGDLL